MTLAAPFARGGSVLADVHDVRLADDVRQRAVVVVDDAGVARVIGEDGDAIERAARGHEAAGAPSSLAGLEPDQMIESSIENSVSNSCFICK